MRFTNALGRLYIAIVNWLRVNLFTPSLFQAMRLVSALTDCVTHVVEMCAEKQMRRVDAPSIVATVKNVQRLVEISVGYLIADSVRGSVVSHAPIAETVNKSNPRPAFVAIASNGLRPQAVGYRFFPVMTSDPQREIAFGDVPKNASATAFAKACKILLSHVTSYRSVVRGVSGLNTVGASPILTEVLS